jgi:signal transduction histidine kinase
VRIAVANLLRNAIEHGGAGTIRVALDDRGSISIRSPRQGLPPAEIARLYAESVRSGETKRRGIGLELIARLCEHMGWRLDIEDAEDGGTGAVLHLR